MNQITLILPYFNQPKILDAQLNEIASYPSGVKVIVVDDGSQVSPAEPVFKNHPETKASLYRINEDVAWNDGGARNLGAYVADTDWLLHTDIDHVLPVESARNLLDYPLNDIRWYKFPRLRIGKADETRKRDQIGTDEVRGFIHPHMSSHLMTRKMFLSSPCDERYSGCIGGDTPFLNRIEKLYGHHKLLPVEICLNVHTRNSVEDANITTLSRSGDEWKRRQKKIGLNDKPESILNFTWQRIV